MKHFQTLREHLHEINDLNSASALLTWDQSTYMPEGGAVARGRQLATLRKIAHEKMVSKETEALIVSAEKECTALPPESFEKSLLRVVRREFEKSVRVPSEFMARFSNHVSSVYDAWIKAKPDNDFKRMIPFLEKTLDLSREYSGFFPTATHPADPHIDNADEGMKAETVRKLFSELRQELVPLVKAISEKKNVDASVVAGHFDKARQLQFGESVVRDFGYCFVRGRQDLTHHPFMIKFSLGDVRITTRYKEDDVTDALFSTMHEAGHAMYEQGIDESFEGTPLARGTSAGVHESQSRLWENLVGRSLGFWSHYYPRLQEAFPEPLKKVSLEQFYKNVNRVEPSLVRVDADEVTYNLHVMIRFDLELAMLEGKLAIRDLPDAWNARYKSDLGITPPNFAMGCMQDVHWHCDFIGGMFQCYTIGNILSAQFFEAAMKAHPQIPAEISKGQFKTLHTWLVQNVYKHGAMFTPDELVPRATGKALTISPYVHYLKKKYGEIYGV